METISKPKSWIIPGITGIEFFREQALTHHYHKHSHSAYAIGFIESGVGGIDCRGGANYTPAGDIVVINPGEVHTGYSAGNQPLSYRMIYISESAFQALLPEKTDLPLFPDLSVHHHTLAHRLQQLHYLAENSVNQLTQMVELTEFLITFSNQYSNNRANVIAGNEPYAITLIKEYLQAHYQRNVMIDELTQLTHLSRAYLIRAFRKAVGIPPHTYLLQIRVERSKLFLAAGKTVRQTAYEVGFADQSHLTRCFKRIVGVTPKQYQIGHYHSRNPASNRLS